jgi:hypothetical protein
MQKTVVGALVAAVGTAFLVSLSLPASAQLARTQSATIANSENMVTLAQYRRGDRRTTWRRDGRRSSRSSAAGIGFGLAAGALLGSAIASQPRYYYQPYGYVDQEAIAYCMQRFRSYDPASGTYLGYDGLRHPCP